MENERLAFWRVVDGAIDERAIRRYAKKHAKDGGRHAKDARTGAGREGRVK